METSIYELSQIKGVGKKTLDAIKDYFARKHFVKTSPKTKRGDIQINTLYREDCRETMNRMPNGFVDLTVTSPPYDNLREYQNKSSWNFDIFKEVASELYRVTKEGGVVVWIVNDATIDGSETGTSFRQALYFMDIGFNLHDTMIYQKTGAGAVGSNKCYLQNFEYMFVFSKGKIKTTNLLYDRENVKTNPTIVNNNRQTHNADTKRKYKTITREKMGRRFNVWEVEQRNNQDKYHKLHPAPFPKQLVRDHIISWSNEGDLVYDPFAGSGTTPKEAKVNNRNYIASEVVASYCDIIEKRMGEIE